MRQLPFKVGDRITYKGWESRPGFYEEILFIGEHEYFYRNSVGEEGSSDIKILFQEGAKLVLPAGHKKPNQKIAYYLYAHGGVVNISHVQRTEDAAYFIDGGRRHGGESYICWPAPGCKIVEVDG